MTTKLTNTGIVFNDSTTQTTAAQEEFASGTVMLFRQTNAPTGWTKQTTHNNKALRVVTGTVSSGGNAAFTTAFASYTPSGNVSVSGSVSVGGTVGSTTLSINQIPSHSHTTTFVGYQDENNNISGYGGIRSNSPSNFYTNVPSGNSGGGGSHNHNFSGNGNLSINSSSFSGAAKDLAVQYVDIIIATKA